MKKNIRFFLVIFVLFMFGIIEQNTVSAQSDEVLISNNMPISKSLSQTLYYSYDEYNMNIGSPFFNPFPDAINFNDGYYAGRLYISSWYTSPDSYVVTYTGNVTLQPPYVPTINENEV